jgi:hypothetical protein
MGDTAKIGQEIREIGFTEFCHMGTDRIVIP